MSALTRFPSTLPFPTSPPRGKPAPEPHPTVGIFTITVPASDRPIQVTVEIQGPPEILEAIRVKGYKLSR